MGYRPEGSLRLDGRPLDDPVLLDEVGDVLLGGRLSNDALLREEGGQWTIHGDPTEAAFLVAEAKVGGLAEAREARFERVGEVPFSSERKLMTTLQADAERGGIAVVTKGAPDVLLGAAPSERPARFVRSRRSAARRFWLLVDRLGGRRCGRSASRTDRLEEAVRPEGEPPSTSSSTWASSGSSTRRDPRRCPRSLRRPRPE